MGMLGSPLNILILNSLMTKEVAMKREVRRPVWLEINLDNLEHNLNEIKEKVGHKAIIMPVIKANGYGHGSVQLAKFYKNLEINMLAVSILQEAVELRQNHIDGDILVLNYTPEDSLDAVVDFDLTQSIYTLESAEKLSDLAVKKDKEVKIHIKVDSGMGRLGLQAKEQLSVDTIDKIYKLPNVQVEGIFTHFARADEFNKEATIDQMEKFNFLLEKLEDKGIDIPLKHVSNSAAIIDLPDYNFNIVRPGIMLYGYYPSNEVNKSRIDLKAAMTLKAEISNVKEVDKGEGISYGHIFTASRKSKIATIPIGYADGYSRMLSEGAFVSIQDKRLPVAGRICMDQMMIDVTDLDHVNIGDEVVLFGVGKNSYPKVEELALILGTINYELICMMGRRIPRKYIRRGEIVEIVDYLLNY